jgi:amidase
MRSSLKQLLDGSVVDLAAAIARQEVTSEEVTRACLARIRRWNPVLQAFVTYGERRALFQARRADARIRARDGRRLPPFLGVPTGIKDLNLTRDFPTRFGSRAVRVPYLPIDDALTSRMREAGFVVLGKLATSEIGALPVAEPLIHGPTLTPWCFDETGRIRTRDALGLPAPRLSGGSSAGSGSAVAAGLVPIAPGSDGAGSVRIPAAFGGLVGIKPSRHLVRNAFWRKDPLIFYTDGPIARTVQDAAALLDVLAGLTVGAPNLLPIPSETFAETCRRVVTGAPRTARPLRIAVSFEHALAPTQPDIRQALERVASLLSDAGHEVVERPWFALNLDDFLPIWQHATTQSRATVGDRGVLPTTAWLRREGDRVSPARFHELIETFARQCEAWFEGFDVIVSPTTCEVAPPLGLAAGDDGERGFRNVAKLGAFTAPFNLTGQPALALPIGLDRTGFPMSVQLAGPVRSEPRLLELAAWLEATLGPLPPCALRQGALRQDALRQGAPA